MKTWILDDIPAPATLGLRPTTAGSGGKLDLRPGNPALARTAAHQLCKTHPGVDYKTAWGCPECVRDLRADNARLRGHCERLLWLLDNARVPGEITQTPEAVAELRAALALAEGGGK